MDSKQTKPSQAEKNNPQADAEQLSPEVLDMIKHPPSIDDVMRNLPPEELRNNPALVPEMLDEPSDEMIGFSKD